MEQWRGNIWRQYDDPGGTEEDVQNDRHLSSKVLTNRTNGINVNFLKASKDQASAINNLISSSASSPVNYSNFSSTNTATTASVTIINNNNDSKYLHKKFKKFCATVDSNQETNHQNSNSYSHTSDIRKPVVEPSATIVNSSTAGLLNNNNSEIVEDKNSWALNSHQVAQVTPRHLQTTDEEKQLVKDIIDINNENFMHQGVNYTASSFLITPNPSSSVAVGGSGGGGISIGTGNIVTTLGNHNTNFQLNEVRHKVVSSQEPSAFNQTANGNFVIINSHPLSDYSFAAQQIQAQHPAISLSTSVPTSTSLTTSQSITSSSGSSTPGRYICPYCQLNCAKPSVLQKHIRAHTNERPYPCTPCGFAFKTKSNLYKHCRSRAHIQRTDPTNVGLIQASTEEDGCSLESGDIDEAELLSSQNENLNHHRLSSPSITMESQLNGNFGENSSSSSSNSSSAVLYPVNSSSDTSSVNTKPYKPKFHNYKKLDLSKTNALQNSTAPISTPSTPSTPSFFSTNAGNLTPQIIEERISRIISDNEAIIDNVEALLQKKYHKITGIQRNLSTSSSVSNLTATATTSAEQSTQSNSKLALALLKQQQQQKQHDEEILRYQMSTQPLNLIKMQEPLSVDVGPIVSNSVPKKKYLNENPAPFVITSQNPQEIILQPATTSQMQQIQEKPSQLVIPTSHPQNPEGSIIKDLLLNSKNFGAVDGEAGDGNYTCPSCKVSFRAAEILKYHLICHCGDENIISRSAPISPTSSTSNNNNSNATSPYLPRSSSNEKHSPLSLSTIAQSQLRPTNAALSPRTPSSLQKLAKSQLKIPKQKPENIVISPAISAIKSTASNQQAIVKNPLPSPGPLLGNTRLVDKRFEDEINNVKKQKLEYQAGSSEKKVSPFFDMKFMHEKSAQSKNFPSGGSFIALEGGTEMQTEDISPNVLRHGGLSGGIALEVPVKKEPSPNDPPPITPKLIVTITPTLTPTLTTNTTLFTVGGKNHFQFPPSVTVYNPLTLPLLSTQQASGTQSIVHGGRVIPYVPGIPGPNTMSVINKNDLPPPSVPIKDKRLHSPSMKQNGIIVPPPREVSPMSRPNGVIAKKKSFNFARIADNLEAKGKKSPETGNEPQEETVKESKPAFLRPNTLSLKPGTFTPKQHHGITPTANTLPLISPETPRPSKSCVQLYLNGHAYTYLGLKSSTKPFYCTVNKPQPSYIQNQHKLSMYSNWQIYNGNNPNIFDLSPYSAMSLYDSRQRSSKYAIAKEDKKELVCLVEMQSIKVTPSVMPTNYQVQQVTIKDEHVTPPNNIATPSMVNYDNNSEEYTYIRGRGRGKYICQECGIRCKKPSMLKKHIRTHTDLRPYTCSYCEFSFKTKGNLTKHMKSKAHFKKCSELGISPIPTMPDDDMNEMDDCSESSRRHMMNGKDESSRCDSETEDNDSEDEMDDDSGDEDTDESKSRMPEHEAAQLLLSLSNHAGTRPPSENSMPMTHQPIVQNDRVEPAAVPRSRIIFSNTKSGDFDFHDLGIKYYSDPSLSHPKDMQIKMLRAETFEDEDDAIPMDLTKKPQASQASVRMSEVITTISDPAILNQLVSNTDKIPSHYHVQGTSMNFTDTIQHSESFLPSEYHMERALKDARIKQIQQAGKVTDYERLQITPVKEQKMKVEENLLFVTKNIPQAQVSNKSGMMDALAELAAKSDKLEVKSDESKNIAMNVASEYLKLTQQKLNQRQDENSVEGSSDQETQEPAAILLTPQNIVVGEEGFHKKRPTSNALFNSDPLLYTHMQDDSGRPVCVVCQKTFQKASQLKIHMNIHYMERKYRCEACSVSFRTQGHLQKHERSVSHQNKVNMTSTFGVPTVSNPRPFKCKDCKIAFRIHGHLAKHLRSKMHVLKLECLQKLPFGTYAEMERAGFNLTDIDTSDCDNSLMSLRTLAKKLNEKDPTKLGPLPPLPNEDDYDESGMNENYDSDSSLNEEDSGMLKRKLAMDESEFENLKKMKQTEIHDHVPSMTSHPNNNDDEKNACAKN